MSFVKKLPVSAIILAHIYDDRLENAIQSILFCREVIVVTNNQKIDWSKLQKQPGIKLIDYPKKIEDFSKARNWAIKQAKFDWVLFIDSDEKIVNPKHAIKIISQAIKTPHVAFNFFRNDVFHNFELKHGETAKQKQTKLINKTKAKFIRPIHETIECEQRKKVADLPIILLHYSHLSINDFLRDIDTYAQKEALYRCKKQKLNKYLVFFELLTFPLLKFIYNYFLKLGFADKMPGLIYASAMSFHSLLVRIYCWQLITCHDH